jgi:hypothetical protein
LRAKTAQSKRAARDSGVRERDCRTSSLPIWCQLTRSPSVLLSMRDPRNRVEMTRSALPSSQYVYCVLESGREGGMGLSRLLIWQHAPQTLVEVRDPCLGAVIHPVWGSGRVSRQSTDSSLEREHILGPPVAAGKNI